MSRMTQSARAIGTKGVAILEVSLVERLAIQICDLLVNLHGILKGTFFLSELLDKSARRSDNQRWYLDHTKLS